MKINVIFNFADKIHLPDALFTDHG